METKVMDEIDEVVREAQKRVQESLHLILHEFNCMIRRYRVEMNGLKHFRDKNEVPGLDEYIRIKEEWMGKIIRNLFDCFAMTINT